MNADQANPPSKCLLWSEVRAGYEFATFIAAAPWLRALPRGDGHPVLVFPGLAASDDSTRPLRGFLRDRGYAVHGWKLGRNTGLKPGSEDRRMERLREIRQRYGRKVSLIGWSLGGIFARELAKRSPDDVRQIITLGSPLRGNPKASNAWQLYEPLSGHTVEDVLDRVNSEPPSVPMTAIFSRTDGIVAWQCSMQPNGAKCESVEVQGNHCGLAHLPAAVYVIADRLAQVEGLWKPFDRSGLRSLVYPALAGNAGSRLTWTLHT